MNTADTPLTLKKSDNQSGGALVIDLDAPDVVNSLQESSKLNPLLLGGIAVAIFFAAMILWAVIPRKDDMLVQDDER